MTEFTFKSIAPNVFFRNYQNCARGKSRGGKIDTPVSERTAFLHFPGLAQIKVIISEVQKVHYSTIDNSTEYVTGQGILDWVWL